MPTQQDSLYEHLQEFTTVQTQHFVDNFSGDAPDTFRWGFGNQDASTGNTATMDDSVNGGIKISCGTSAGYQGMGMAFLDGTATDGSDNNYNATMTKPFRSGTANMIFTAKFPSHSTNGDTMLGFNSKFTCDNTGGNMATLRVKSGQTNFTFRTSNSGGTSGDTTSTTPVAQDTDWHGYKISGNVTADPTPAGQAQKLYIDGVLEASRTSAIGYFNETVTPIFSTRNNNSTSNGSYFHVGYCEAWNG